MQFTREEETLVAAMQGNAVEDSRDTRRDKTMHMAGDFESAVAAIAAGQHSRTAEVRLGALARTAQSYSSIQQWRRKMYQQVWNTQAHDQTYKRIKRNNDEDTKEKKMTDESIRNTKAILKKMIENKKFMKKKVDKDTEVAWKTTASKRKSKSKNQGQGRSKKE